MSLNKARTNVLTPKVKDPVRAAAEYGIDITLLRDRLMLTPTQRLEKHQQMLEFVEELQKAARRRRDKS